MVANLPSGYVFRPKGRELIEHYLVPKALGGYVIPGFVAEGVDVFSATPDALPFSHNHRRDNGEVWGYFFAAQPVGEGAVAPAPGGCWFPYGREKAYRGAANGGETVAFRRRLRYHVLLQQGGGDCGTPVWASTPWLMTEFRINKVAAAFRCARLGHKANMDSVVRKVFTKPAVPPPPPPAGSTDDESTGSNYPSADDEAGYSGEEHATKRARFC
jgi:hypothetical protein